MNYYFLIKRIIFFTTTALFVLCDSTFTFAKLNNERSADKMEGYYFTGLPLVNFSSDDGLGYGLRFYFYENGRKSDTDFNNIPYNIQIYCQYFRTTEGYQYHELNLDYFNMLNSGLRAKISLVYEERLNANFYGIGANSANQKLGNKYDTYNEYEKHFLKANNYSNYKYNKYTLTAPEYCMDIYRDILKDFKFLFGLQFRYVDINPWDGRNFKLGIFNTDSYTQSNPTFLTEIHPIGYRGGWTNFARIGISYDTRDFEPDPHEGVYLDYVFDINNKILGSEYNFNRSTAGARLYLSLSKSLVIAGRAAYTDANGNIPFYEMDTFSFFYNRYNGLGGYRTLRGYQRDRFVGPTMTMGNMEIRYSFAKINPFGQQFNIKAVGFTDTGNVYDKAKDPFTDPRFGNYKIGYGGGLVIAWNMSTIIHFYYGVSREDSSLSVNFNHSLD
jgi:outer membrane translocation and assembly module TamA